MKPAVLCERIREDHRVIREMVREVELLAREFVQDGADVAGKLRECGIALLERLCRHLDFEQSMLLPALRACGGPLGYAHALRLDAEHRDQRDLFEYLLRRLGMRDRPTLLVARELESFAAVLRDDMKHEEEVLLREHLLKEV